MPGFVFRFCLPAPEGRPGARAWAFRGFFEFANLAPFGLPAAPSLPPGGPRQGKAMTTTSSTTARERIVIFDTTLRDGEQCPSTLR